MILFIACMKTNNNNNKKSIIWEVILELNGHLCGFSFQFFVFTSISL